MVLLASVLAAGACFDPALSDGQFRCAEVTGDCPDGQVCASDGFCVSPAGAGDGPDADVSDAGPLGDGSEPDGPTTISATIVQTSDDAEQFSDGKVTIVSVDYELAQRPYIGLRFTELAIPQRAEILAAQVQFVAREVTAKEDGDPAVTAIIGQNADDAPTFVESDLDLSARPRTAAEVVWNIPRWLQVDDAGPAQRTPDLSAVIQEIVDRPGWSAGNAVVLLFLANKGRRAAKTFDSAPVAGQIPVPVLDITWQPRAQSSRSAVSESRR